MINNIQFKDWQGLAETIREELRECAWLLSLLDDQQRAILDRDAIALLSINESIEEQYHQVRLCHDARLNMMREASATRSLVQGASIMDLAPYMPAVLKPLFEALSGEARSLRDRIKRRTAQNHRMLERASMVVSEMLNIIRPGSVTRTYGRKGKYRTSTSLKGSVVHTAV
ncbi:MAG: flagellar protein FlgN [Opitutales bacterium]|jgi:flagellar biosynthesis/type III secretory pathway chaperone